MGNMTVSFINQTGSNPFNTIRDVKNYWDNPKQHDSQWRSPDGLFWICGKRGFVTLPRDWKGTCTIGIIQPAFFLLPKWKGNYGLGLPL
ncbi:ENR1 protein, partial [Bucco capensis]|nr:ENR1 protein [Bucco capensis]